MGFFNELFGKKEVPRTGSVYSLECSLHPYRLEANKNTSIDLDISVKNRFDREQLTSIVIVTPKTIGFDQSALSNQREIRLGDLNPKETRNLKIQVWGTGRTNRGDYHVAVFAIAHYRDYSYVLNETKKVLDLRVV